MENMVSVWSSVLDRFSGKCVLLTGHTGFKGSWLSFLLSKLGAHVVGYSLEPPTSPSLFELANIDSLVQSYIGDIRDYEAFSSVVTSVAPHYIIHFAAQPLVLDGYRDPKSTYETNVMGTVNVLEAARRASCVESIIVVTTDKVYKNNEIECYGYAEDDSLGGYDPYSNSKSCADLVVHSYFKSYFEPAHVPVSVARAGNVIGGGDFASNRIIPDCVRAAKSGEPLIVRNPHSTRPYQHVLEPLIAYLMIAARQIDQFNLAGAYNVGPDDCDCVRTGDLVALFADQWGNDFTWIDASGDLQLPHEANYLKLNADKIKQTFGWRPRWHIAEAMQATTDWYREYLNGGDIEAVMNRQIENYLIGRIARRRP